MPQPLSRRAFLSVVTTAISSFGASAQQVSRAQPVAAAEEFIIANGYTDAPLEMVKADLDSESIEFPLPRNERLAWRFNKLKRKAIGLKRRARGRESGWSVAFDYTSGGPDRDTCRVVTMDDDGSNMVLQHVDGLRDHFVGFD